MNLQFLNIQNHSHNRRYMRNLQVPRQSSIVRLYCRICRYL
nr:MAG TPA: hypothetical protein [Caudoviricetes sp.]